MGEVYRAKDTKLGRDVAVKILPDSVAHDPERLARFEREAKLLASLTHANIAALYALDRGDNRHFLVMELAAGDDLSARIDRGPVPLDEALAIASQVARALEAAHDAGIVHRDLKPANIKVTSDGGVKVLDFGLAKALGPDAAGAASGAAMNSPTLTAQATAAGLILGTAAYMSPEQARGRDADKRADIWAFGVVLFEMLTGARQFQGETISDTLAAVLRQDITLANLPAGTPGEIRRLLRRCLERDRKNRLHDIADARIVLEEVARGAEPEAAAAAVPATPSRARWPLGVGLGVAMLAIGALGGYMMAPPATTNSAAGIVRLVIPMPPDVTYVGQPAVAADGTFVVFAGQTASRTTQLYLHRFDEAVPRALARTEGAGQPFVSPDGRWIGFRRAEQLEKISVEGGEPLPLAKASWGAPGSTWVPGGPIVYGVSWLGGLSAVSPEGGEVRRVTELDAARGEIGHWFPSALPDGRHVLFTVWLKATGMNDAETALLDLQTGKYRILFKGGEPHFIAPNAIVFFRAGTYHAVRFDLGTLSVSGEPVRVLDDARGNVPEGQRAETDMSATGTLAYLNGQARPDARLVWVAPGGALTEIPVPARAYAEVSLAPGGRIAAAGVLEAGRYVIRLLDFGQRTDDSLDLPGSNWTPVWHPDRRRIAFRAMRKGDFDTYWKDVTSSAPPEPLLVTDLDETPGAFTPDGKSLIVQQSEADGTYPLKLLSLEPPGGPVTLVPFSSNGAAVRPDGKFAAFASRRSGTNEIYLVPLTGKGAPERVSSRGGQAAAWSVDGRELYYARPPEILAVTMQMEGGRLRPAGERVWARVEGSDPEDIFSVGPDGRILIALPKEPLVRQIRVVLGWDREVAEKLSRR